MIKSALPKYLLIRRVIESIVRRENPGIAESSDKDQNQSLSDLVFGLALSIGSLELLARTPQTPEDLATIVALFAFNFSFLIVVSIWFGYARIMAVISQETRRGHIPESASIVLCGS